MLVICDNNSGGCILISTYSCDHIHLAATTSESSLQMSEFLYCSRELAVTNPSYMVYIN